MYNSQYYTCEQIDERLLQGYVDDYNTQTEQNLTKAQFIALLKHLFDAFGEIGIDNEPTPDSENLVKSGGVYGLIEYLIDYQLFDDAVELVGNNTPYHYKVFANISNSLLSKRIGNNIKVEVGNITTDLTARESFVQLVLFNSNGGYALREGIGANTSKSFIIPSDAVRGELRFYTSVESPDTSGYTYSISNVNVELSGATTSIYDQLRDLKENKVPKSDIIQEVTENQTSKLPSSDAVYKHTKCSAGKASGVSITDTTISTDIPLKANRIYKIYLKSDTLISSSDPRKGLWVSDEQGTYESQHQIKSFTSAEIYAGATYIYTPSEDCYLRVRTCENGISWHTEVYCSILDFSIYTTDQLRDLKENKVPKSDIVQNLSNQENKIPSSATVLRALTTQLAEMSGVTKTTAPAATDILLKAGSPYRIYVKTEELVDITDNRQGLWTTLENGGTSTWAQITRFTPQQMYEGVYFDYTPSNNVYLWVRTYRVGDHYTCSVSGLITELPTIVRGIRKSCEQLKEQVDSNTEDIDELKLLLEDTIFYNNSCQKTGTGASQPFDVIKTITRAEVEPFIGKNLTVEVGNIVSDLPEGRTAFQLAFYEGSSYIKRVKVVANTTSLMEIPSNVTSIQVRFYTAYAYNDTAGFVYSCDNIKVYVPSEYNYDSAINSLQEQVTANAEDIGELQGQLEQIEEVIPTLSPLNPWNGKNVVVWGDSITAQGNGDNPGTSSFMYWAKTLLGFANLYQRGVGGQTYIWNTSGWYCKAQGGNGNYVNRYKYDAQGQQLNEVVSPETVTSQEIANIQAHYGYSIEVHYGCFCSWDRIKAMIPENIRTTIDLIILCGGTNDHSRVEEVEVEGDMSAAEPEWVANNNTDPTWAADNTYYKGGDYDITTFSGAIASTIMKMLTWCPNAVVVLATPFPRFNLSTKMQYVNNHDLSFRRLCEIEDTIAHFVSTDVIDANGKCNINGVNYANYQTDGVHPNLEGRKMYGRVFVNELIRIANKIG